MAQFTGIFPALLTPFTKENKINEKALESLVKMNLKKGVSGFYVGGSTAEAFLLTQDERKYILDIVKSSCEESTTIIYHVGSISTKEAIDLAQYGELKKVDAISSIPPFYYNFSFAEIKDYYFDIVNNVELPMIIYNFPAFSGVSLNDSNINVFLDDDRFIGVKHTSNDFFSLERFKSLYPNKFVYNGYDEMFISGYAAGADGGIGSTYNFMAEKFIEMEGVIKQGKLSEAREIQKEVNEMIKILIKVGVLPGEKEVLNQLGFDFGECRSPFKKLSDDEKSLISKKIIPFCTS